MIITENSSLNILKNSVMTVSEMAYAKLGSEWSSPVFCAPYTRIYFVTEGTAAITVNSREYILKKGNIYIIPYGCKFSYRCDSVLEKMYFHLTWSVYNTDIMASVTECITITDGSLFTECLNLSKNKTPHNILLLKLRLQELLLYSLEYTQKPIAIVKHSETVSKVLKYIDANLRYDLTVKEISDALFMSESTLGKLFKREMGISVGKYITDRILTLAEEKIRLKKESVLSVSEFYGFRDRFYFSRLFAKKYGIPPAKYRKTTDY